MRREFREHFPRHWFQKKPIINDPGMHHGTCVTHMPWCMSGSLTRGGGENVPGIPGARATRNFTYLVRGPLWRPLETRIYVWWMSRRHSSDMAINLFKKNRMTVFIAVDFAVPIKSVHVKFDDDLMTLKHFPNHLTFKAGYSPVSSGFLAKVVSDAQQMTNSRVAGDMRGVNGHGTPDSKLHGANVGPPGSCRPHMWPMLAPWTLLSGTLSWCAIVE